MQTLSDIRRILQEAGLAPQKQFGQCFLFERNLMLRLLELADVPHDRPVLEVGPGTGSLTEELLERASCVVAVEIDRGLGEVLGLRLGGRGNLRLMVSDVLAGKRQISPLVLKALGPRADLVSNLPYNIATPVVAQCLLSSWRAIKPAPASEAGAPDACRFERLTFTVQREVADRMSAVAGDESYGAVSVLAALLGRVTQGPDVPPSAFWPKPKVSSRILRIDFIPAAAARLADADTLQSLLAAAFGQRRKQIGSLARRRGSPFAAEAFEAAIKVAGVEPSQRAQTIAAEQFLIIANKLAAAAHSDAERA